MLADQKIPQFVYRMRPVNKFLFDSLVNCQLWFSNPKDFNDPFDCDINMRVRDCTSDQMQAYFEAHLKRFLTPDELAQINPLAVGVDTFEKYLNQAAKRVIQRKGIACFLSDYKNLLMWAHYADAHRGICLKFDVEEDARFFSPSKLVKYHVDYPVYDYLAERDEFVSKLFFTKSRDWEYEGEVRVLKNRKGNYEFKSSALKEVIFGCKISEEDKNTLTKILRVHYPACELRQARQSNHSFSLDFEPIG
jgi:hypothetical protein